MRVLRVLVPLWLVVMAAALPVGSAAACLGDASAARACAGDTNEGGEECGFHHTGAMLTLDGRTIRAGGEEECVEDDDGTRHTNQGYRVVDSDGEILVEWVLHTSDAGGPRESKTCRWYAFVWDDDLMDAPLAVGTLCWFTLPPQAHWGHMGDAGIDAPAGPTLLP